jgi:hypothetical protein
LTTDLLRSAGTIYFSSANVTLGNFGMADGFWFEVFVLLVGFFLALYGRSCFITNLGCLFSWICSWLRQCSAI